MICAMAELDRSIFKTLLGPILPVFTEALVTGLNLPDDSHFTDAGLKTEVLKGENTSFLHKTFARKGFICSYSRYVLVYVRIHFIGSPLLFSLVLAFKRGMWVGDLVFET